MGDLGSIPVLGRDPLEKGKYSAWGIPWPVVSLGAKSWTQLSDFQFTSGQTERKEVEKTPMGLHLMISSLSAFSQRCSDI